MATVEQRAQRTAEAEERKEEADWDGFSDRSEGKRGVEVNSRLPRPGFRAEGGVIQGGDAGGSWALRGW